MVKHNMNSFSLHLSRISREIADSVVFNGAMLEIISNHSKVVTVLPTSVLFLANKQCFQKRMSSAHCRMERLQIATFIRN